MIDTEMLIATTEICVACGNPLPTESTRMICKECEERLKNESDSKT